MWQQLNELHKLLFLQEEKMQLNKAKMEILEKINIVKELEKVGVKFVGPTNSKGWKPVLNPYKPEINSSSGVKIEGKGKGYLVSFNEPGQKGKPQKSRSFFNVIADFKADMYGDPMAAVRHYAKELGIPLKTNHPPEDDYVEKCIKNPTKAQRKQLFKERGFTEATILKHKIGYSTGRKRFTIPVYDKDGKLVNICYYRSTPDQKPKMLNHAGYGQARLWGVDRLVKTPQRETVVTAEGEADAMLLTQETGLTAVSPTNGTNAFAEKWVKNFHGYHVVLVWDCDEEGRDSVTNLILPIFQDAVASGKVKSIKIVWLFEAGNKNRKDFTDYIVKTDGTGEKLLKLIENTATHEYTETDSDGTGAAAQGAIDEKFFFSGKHFVPLRLVHVMTARSDLFHDGSGFYRYDRKKGVWKPIHDNLIGKNMMRALGEKSRQASIKDAAKLLEFHVFKSSDELACDRHLINFANGMLNLRTSQLELHDKYSYVASDPNLTK